ncbi:MAG: rhomboid family intramembrane serine protease [Deltaproteobacteria bacterium]|nr:rhomboid family intramembrane serine protease [Deltaproteobacteria bacterium]
MIRLRDGDEERLLTQDEFERAAARGEISPLAWVCIPDVTEEKAFVQARSLDLFLRVYDPRRFHFRRYFHVVRFPLFTLILSAICIGLYTFAVHLGGGAATPEVLLNLGAKTTVRMIEEGETYRLLMANLLNRDLVHLSFNLVALLAVGTVLEGVYRRGDLLLLFIISGLSCMTLSALFTHGSTVGASGLVFGCLGAAAVFGWRFRDILPRRYRAFFGSVILFYTGLMFYLGVVNPSTDNWGHAGGLAAGAILGGLLQPRLLRLKGAQETLSQQLRPYLLSLVLVVGVVVIGPFTPGLFFYWERVDIAPFGVSLERPKHWQEVPGPLGFLAFGNELDAFLSIGCTPVEGISVLDEALSRFHNELLSLEQSGSISILKIEDASFTTLGKKEKSDVLPALKVPFQLIEQNGSFSATAILFSRGHLECAVVKAFRPSSSAATRALLQEMLDRIVIGKTEAQLKSSARAERNANRPELWIELALSHQTAGDTAGARRALSRAESLVEDDEQTLLVRIGFARARFELALGSDFDAAHRALRRALSAGGERADLLLLEAQVHGHEGNTTKAYMELDDVLRRFSDDDNIRARVENIRSQIEYENAKGPSDALIESATRTP